MDIEIKQSGLRKDPPTWKGKITESALFQKGGGGLEKLTEDRSKFLFCEDIK